MIEKTRCRNCRKTYELIWDDTDIDDWRDDFEDSDEEEIDLDSDDPVYCPFCGTHCDYDE
jgi:hypothetical protein